MPTITETLSSDKKTNASIQGPREITCAEENAAEQSTRGDEFVPSSSSAVNDGKFSIVGAAKNFAKGLFKPITTLFSSTRNFIFGRGIIAGGAILTALTGGAILPVFIAVGVAFGLIEAVSGIHKICTAKNGADIEKAFLDFGSATSSIGLSFLGVRGALKPQNASVLNVSRTKAIFQCFRDIPQSIGNSFKNSYTNISTFFSNTVKFVRTSREQISQIRSVLRENKMQTRQIKSMTDKMYDEEIKLLAERLGAREDRLRRVMPERINYTVPRLGELLLKCVNKFLDARLGGFSFHLGKPRTFVNPRSVINGSPQVLKGTTPRYRAIDVVSHEVNHGGQTLFPISQLTYKEYIRAAEQVISKVYAGDPKSIENHTKLYRIIAFFRYRSTAGRRIRSLGIPKTEEAKLKAIRFLQDEVEVGKANGLIMEGTTGPYKEAFKEVDSRMYSMFRRLQTLVDDILHGRNSSSHSQEFIATQAELQGEVSSFTNPTREHLPTLLQSIHSLFNKARKELLT